MFTFVSGGLRSGKSSYALRRASEFGPPPWLYVAAHIDGDGELKGRLANHRRDHETTWKLIEAPDKLITALDPAMLEGCGAVVIDRFTVWLSKRMAETDKSPGVLLASGYIAGGALAGIVIALLAGAMKTADDSLETWATEHNPLYNGPWADGLSMIFFAGLCLFLYLVGREKLLGPRKAPH